MALYGSPDCQINRPFSSGEIKQNRFPRLGPSLLKRHLEFLIGTILTIFYLQVTLMLPTKFGVSWPFGSVEEAKNRFSRWLQPWWPSWISDQNDFSYFDLLVTPKLPIVLRLLFQEKKRKIDFQDGSHGSHLEFPIGTILAIFDQ